MSRTTKSHRHRRRLARLIFRDGPECVWCGTFLTKDDERASCDHVIPRVAGGSLWLDNLVLACRACNNLRHELDALEYLSRCERDRAKQPHRKLVVAAIMRSRSHPACKRRWLENRARNHQPMPRHPLERLAA